MQRNKQETTKKKIKTENPTKITKILIEIEKNKEIIKDGGAGETRTLTPCGAGT